MLNRPIRGAAALALTFLALCVLGLAPSPAMAADSDCAQFTDQLAAQTSSTGEPDVDGDGLVCEQLPCPCFVAPPETPLTTATAVAPPGEGVRMRVVDVIDGRTLVARELSGAKRTRRIRLVGVDGPEVSKPGVAIECGGQGALDSLLRATFKKSRDSDHNGLRDAPRGRGRAITVVNDPKFPSNRAYVYVANNGGQLNLRQLRGGWGRVGVSAQPLTQLVAFQAAVTEAREKLLGLWGACEGEFHIPGSVIL